MTIREAAAFLGAEMLQNEFEDTPLAGAYTSDLLSDVIAHAGGGGALITIQAHRNTVAVAALVRIPCVIICNGRSPPGDMLKAARSEGIAVLLTAENQFTVSGKLYAALESP